jgi:UDPglucose--hexose-1-phosphate uridylyltransferase
MPELRQNIATGEWVIISTERARRPEEFIAKEGRKPLPDHKDTCPFCPGNESQTPSTLFAFPPQGPWQLRVMPNKFAALAPDIPFERENDGFFRKATGYGFHQVIVENPLHNLPLPLLTQDRFDLVVEAYHRASCALAANPKVEFVIPFKNHGEGAGTSLEHPHSQIIGLPIFPGQVRNRMEEAIRFYDSEGVCVFCKMVEMERREGSRIVEENESFVAFLPFAAFSPFHLWIFPLRHEATFQEITDPEKKALGLLLRRVLRRVYLGLRDPDYNLMIRSGPVDAPKLKYFHWYISVVPRMAKAAGFELGSGMYINTALPEESARFLRGVEI